MAEGGRLWPLNPESFLLLPHRPWKEGGWLWDEGLPCHAGTSSGSGDKKPGVVPDSGWFSVTPEAGHLRAWVPSSLRRENIHYPAYHM